MRYSFASWKTMVALIFGWGAACYAADLALHPRPIDQIFSTPADTGPTASDKPHVVITMNHLCCSGCASDVNAALKTLPWVGATEVKGIESMDDANTKAESGGALTLEGARNKIEFDVRQEDLPKVDFVALDNALRNVGLTADRIDFTGVQHYRLEAEFKHVCCGLCAKGLENGMGVAKQLKATGQFGWIDSVTVSKMAKLLTIHARYGSGSEIEELISAINKIGFQPQALRIKVGSET